MAQKSLSKRDLKKLSLMRKKHRAALGELLDHDEEWSEDLKAKEVEKWYRKAKKLEKQWEKLKRPLDKMYEQCF